MPKIPTPIASPDLMPWIRWAQGAIEGLIKDAERKVLSDANTNASQNSTVNLLIDRLASVQAIMDTIGSSLTIDASQVVSGTLDNSRIPGLPASQIVSGTIDRPVNTSGDLTAAGHGTFNAAWNYDVSAVTRRAVWMDSTGRMGQTASTERLKKDIEKWSPEEQAVLAMDLVRFHWKDERFDKHWEYGLIAERLHELGLTWLVSYEEDGSPHSVHYDRIALALLPTIQALAKDRDRLLAEVEDHTDRLRNLEERLASLEARN